ncbi:hypothetical protein HYW68_00635 [Candidatus Parcubacteria bacterium]|nr:hypothetical protein [Candidatus Parcubacteria bacterium]
MGLRRYLENPNAAMSRREEAAMKILVVEDNEQYAKAAAEELTAAGHEVKVMTIGTYYKEGPVEAATTSDGLMGKYVSKKDSETYYLDPPRSEFDAALFDLFLPEENIYQTFDQADPARQQPYGLILALRAAQCGVKYVGIISDANHHTDAFSAALDFICPPYWWSGKDQPVFRINESIVGIARTDCHEPDRKRWLDMLNHLIAHRDAQR